MGISKSHFNYIFIDEAGQGMEPECLVPIAGLLDSDGQLVLAGDPKQLGPVLRSPIAIKVRIIMLIDQYDSGILAASNTVCLNLMWKLIPTCMCMISTY